MRTRLGQWVGVGALWAALAACGGGGENGASPAPQAEPAAIGAAGGKVAEAGGATVIVPAGALDADTTIRVAMDSTGAPPLPDGLAAAGNTYVITPHGGEFAQPVEVRIPVPATTLQANQALKLAKAQPGGEWVVLDDSALADGVLSAQVDSFSFFMPVTVTYLLPIAQQEPLRATGSSLDCGTDPCEAALGTITATYTVTTNNGPLPTGCTSNRVTIQVSTLTSNFDRWGSGTEVALGGGSLTRRLSPGAPHYFTAGVRCTGFGLNFGPVAARRVSWAREPAYPNLAVMRAPAQLDVVDGLIASLDVVLAGGASRPLTSALYVEPTAIDRAVIDWQRSDDNGASWRTFARSYQNEANPNPANVIAWQYWSVRHGFTAAAADQGALLRVHACYTPPDVPAPPCVSGPATRLNVLQQSALPVIVGAPRSVLVRTGQTASFSATVSGAPTPTLQWQTRAANSTDAWANVSTGTGGTSGDYTTPVLGAADNGTQYRVVASNALGSAESAAVTVSVSDLDVAPSITTQPASLGVTAGNDAAFAIAARGTEALSYQWRKDGIAITGANGPVLRLPAVGAVQAGAYSVTVSNAAGTVDSDPATLTVSAGVPAAVAPTIVTQPVSVLVNAGNTATFAVGASGSGTLSYQWLRNGQPIGGATAAFYSIASTAIADAGTYAVQVANGVGPGATSSNVVLTVNASTQATPVSLQTQPSPQVQAPGGSATFAVAVTGSGPIGYQWLKDGAPIAGATTAVLTLANVSGSDAADYSVTVNNALATLTSNAARLTVLGAPLIGTQPAAASATEGAAASFSVAATGDALRYQWTRNNVGIVGATSASYTTPALALADSGAVYGVVVYNGAGVVLSQGAVLSVTPAATAPGMALYAGDFSAGGGGNALDGTGTAARFDSPEGLAADGAGNLYVAQANGRRVAKIAPGGVATTLVYQAIGTATNGFKYLALAPDGSLYTAGVSYCGLFRTAPPLSAGATTVELPVTTGCGTQTRGIAVDANGVVHLSLTGNNSIVRVGAADGSGNHAASVLAGAPNPYVPPGSADGTGGAASFNAPRGIAFGTDGDLFVADSGNHTIRRITPAGAVSTFAGVPGSAGTVDGTGTAARFHTPTDLSFDAAGNLLVLERGSVDNGFAVYVRRITPAGAVTTLFNAGDEAAALDTPGQEQFARNITGIAVLEPNRIALTAGNAIVIRTLP